MMNIDTPVRCRNGLRTHRERLTRIIRNVITRCTNKNASTYCGHLGTKIHEQWLYDTHAFMEYLITLPGWDNPLLWLDRRDNDGHYEPGNLRFVTPSESAYNRNNRHRTPEETLHNYNEEKRIRRNVFLHDRRVRVKHYNEEQNMPQSWWNRLKYQQLDIDIDIDAMFNVLQPRYRTVVYMHFWHSMTLMDIGVELGVTRERIRQMLIVALEKLRRLHVDAK